MGFKERQWLSLASAPEPDQMKNKTQEDICPLLVREEDWAAEKYSRCGVGKSQVLIRGEK